MEPRETADRVFNMDDTGFGQLQTTKRVMALHGRNNVCTKTVESNCHVIITSHVISSGFVVPPLASGLWPPSLVEIKNVGISITTVELTQERYGFSPGYKHVKWFELNIVTSCSS